VYIERAPDTKGYYIGHNAKPDFSGEQTWDDWVIDRDALERHLEGWTIEWLDDPKSAEFRLPFR
jgi:hypothetical protein